MPEKTNEEFPEMKKPVRDLRRAVDNPNHDSGSVVDSTSGKRQDSRRRGTSAKRPSKRTGAHPKRK